MAMALWSVCVMDVGLPCADVGREGDRMQIKHCCTNCGEVMAVHEHSSWQEVKDYSDIILAALKHGLGATD
ncbi:MAG: hypothetical protein JOZ29_16475 [Deltaproteobacteria bacterium]|nr:hypothetical protein [Deltaproteobacteria bacterium]